MKSLINKEIKALYLTEDKDGIRKCYISERYSSTLRRSDSGQNIPSSICLRGKNGVILVRMKRKPSFILAPKSLVPESYVFEKRKNKIFLIELFFNRISKGEYVKVNFPKDKWRQYKWKKKRRSELLFLGKKKAYLLDSLLRPMERITNIPKLINSNFYLNGRAQKPYPEFVMSLFDQINFVDYNLKNYYELIVATSKK